MKKAIIVGLLMATSITAFAGTGEVGSVGRPGNFGNANQKQYLELAKKALFGFMYSSEAHNSRLIINGLLENGLDPNQTVKCFSDHLEESLFYCALRLMDGLPADIEMTENFIRHGANLELKNSAGETAVMVAATKARITILKTVLSYSPNLDAKNGLGENVVDMVLSERAKRPQSWDALIDAGGSLSMASNTRENLWMAFFGVMLNHSVGFTYFNQLLDRGFNPNMPFQDVIDNAVVSDTVFGMVVRRSGSSKKHIDLLQKMIDRGANINAINGDGDSIISIAAGCAAFEVTELLLKQPGINLNTRNKKGNTPLMEAISRGDRPKTVQALLKAGASIR